MSGLSSAVSSNTAFCRHFLATREGIVCGETSIATSELGVAWVYGRPHALANLGGLDQVSAADQPGIERFLSAIDGRFSGIFKCRDGWIVATDILGCGPLYFRRVPEGYAVATHMGLLATKGRLSLDPVGFVSSVLGSLSIAGRTPYREISRLGAAEYAIFDSDFTEMRARGRYFEMASAFELGRFDRGDPCELAALLREAVAREGQPDAIFLSGGLDSQAIALSVAADRRPAMRTLSYGGWRSPDRRNGLHIGTSLGYQALAIGPLKLQLTEYWDPVVTLGSGQSGLQVSQHVAGARAARLHASCAFSGFLGDAITGHNEKHAPLDGTVIRKLGHVDAATCAALETMAPEYMSAVRHMLEETLLQWRDLPGARAQTVANLHLRQPSYIGGTFDLMHQEIDIATPFFHRELMRYLLTRSHSDIADQSLYQRTLTSLGRIAADSGNSPLDRHARFVDRRRGRYLTVDWAAVLRRNSPTFDPMIEAIEDPLLKAVAMLPDARGKPLPRWLFVLPIAVTLQQTFTRPAARGFWEDVSA